MAHVLAAVQPPPRGRLLPSSLRVRWRSASFDRDSFRDGRGDGAGGAHERDTKGESDREEAESKSGAEGAGHRVSEAGQGKHHLSHSSYRLRRDDQVKGELGCVLSLYCFFFVLFRQPSRARSTLNAPPFIACPSSRDPTSTNNSAHTTQHLHHTNVLLLLLPHILNPRQLPQALAPTSRSSPPLPRPASLPPA